MAGVYRSMLVDGGKPLVGTKAKMLGVREDGYDIPTTSEQTVRPRTGGLSVAPEWRDLPYFLIPMRLQAQVKEARGSNKLACFRLGEILFAMSSINEELVLRPDGTTHGTIEPSYEMPLTEYQRALADTSDLWLIDET